MAGWKMCSTISPLRSSPDMLTASQWRTYSLSEVAEIHDNLRLPVNASERAKRIEGLSPDALYPYYGATGQVGWIDGYRMDGRFILVGEDGAPFLDPFARKAFAVEGCTWVNNHAHILRGKAGVLDDRFLMHALNAIDYRGHVNGTTRLKLTQQALRCIPIRMPGLEVQRRVAARIDELFTEIDDGEEELRRGREELETYRKSLLQAAVTGQLTAAWRALNSPSETGAQLLGRIRRERPARASRNAKRRGQVEADSPSQDVCDVSALPPNWTRCSYEQCCSTVSDRGLKLKERDYQSEGRFPVVDQGSKAVAGYTDDERLVQRFDTPVILFGDHTRRFKLIDHRFCIGADGVKIIAPHPSLNAEYVWRAFQAAHFEDRGYSRHFQFVRALDIPLPPLEEQEHIADLLSDLLGSANELGASAMAAATAKSAALRQSILASAFRGELVQ